MGSKPCACSRSSAWVGPSDPDAGVAALAAVSQIGACRNRKVVITLTAPKRPLESSCLQQQGGFAWWYLDICDEDARRGLVLIVSYGLPFLPGIADAARRGVPGDPRLRPSINLATYDRGRTSCYVLQELAPQQAHWLATADGEEWRFGDSTLVLRNAGEELIIEADLAIVIDGLTKIEGQLNVRGAPRLPSHDEELVGSVEHSWSPQTGVAHGEVSLDIDGTPFSFAGRAYHDRNGSRRPLHELGIERWIWGRASFPDEERIVYALWPQHRGPVEAFGVSVLRNGRTHITRDLDVEIDQRRTWLGVPALRRARFLRGDSVFLSADAEKPVDVGPFYSRSLWRAQAEDVSGTAPGFCEVVVPDRVDLPRHRPLVRMRVATPSPSLWLPLFCGPQAGRFERLWGSLRGRMRRLVLQ